MSEEQLQRFMEAVKMDQELREKLSAAEDLDVVVRIAKEAGYVISKQELQPYQIMISEEELEGVAGGKAGSLNGCETYYGKGFEIRLGC